MNYANAPPEVRRTDIGTLLTKLRNRRAIEPLSVGKNVFTVMYTQQIPPTEVRRADTGAVIAILPTLGDQRLFLALGPDGAFVVHNRFDGPAQLRRTDGGWVIATLAGEIEQLGFTADGKIFAVGYTNAPPEVRRSETGAVIATLPSHLRIEKFSPDESAFVASYPNAPAELRRTSDGVRLSQLTGQVEKLGVTFSPDGSAFVVNYTGAPAELRRTSDGARLSQLAGQVEKLRSVTFSPDGRAFVVPYDRQGRPTHPVELRRVPEGTVIATFPADLLNSITFSPDGATFVVRYRKGGFGGEAPTEFELRRTENGTLLATLAGDISGDPFEMSFSSNDLNFPPVTAKNSGNGKSGVTFSPDGSTFVVRYRSGRGELWDARGGPRRLADLGVGLTKVSFVFTSGVGRLAVQYSTGQLYLLDVAWLRAMSGRSGQLPAEELVRLACEGPLAGGLWTAVEQAALEQALDGRKPHPCGLPNTLNNAQKHKDNPMLDSARGGSAGQRLPTHPTPSRI